MDISAVEVSDHQLDWQEHRREVQSHTQHDLCLGGKYPAEQVPGSGGGNAEGAGEE
jgi:hypothetical protein